MENKLRFAKRVQGFLINFDFFAIQPNLNVFKKQKYSTLIGAIMTLFVGVITIGYLSLELSELISKSLPNIIQSDKQVVETSSFPLMQSNFTLAVSVGNMNQDPLKKINQYFTITIVNCLRTRSFNATTQKIEVNNVCTTYPTEACTTDDWVTDTQKAFFSKIRLGTVQCIKRDILQSNPPKLQGIVSGTEYAYITIQFSMCKNTTTLQTCAPKEEILQGLNSGYYAVYMSDTLVQMGNRGDISQDIIKMQYTPFSKSSSITIYQTLRIIESLTDVGLITSSIVNDYNLIQQNYREQFTLYNDEYLIYHWIILDDKYTQYQRTYIKLQAILSKIGGLWQILFMSIAILVKPFIETDMYMKICNELFRIETDDIKFEGLNESSKSKFNIQKMIKQLNPKFENSILEVLLITLNCKRKKKSHLELAKMAFFSKIDVVNIAIKSFQSEQLKQILLNEDQRRIFEFIPRPFLQFDKGDQMDFFIQSRRIQETLQISKQSENDEKFQQACRSYFKILQSPMETNDVDKRLLEYLDQDIVQLFHQLNFTKNNSLYQGSLDFLNKRSMYLEQKNQIGESQNCLTPVSLESPAAKVHINKKIENKIY